MRLDRFVSHAAPCSRSRARELIRDGSVRVDGVSVRAPSHRLAPNPRVVCDDRTLRLPGYRYLMMHKPLGVVSATRDTLQPTVVSLLPDDLAARVRLIGRLDKQTSGLLLLSDDGAWTHSIMSPRHRCSKVYVADLAEPLTEDAGRQLSEGVMLNGETTLTRPAELRRLGETRMRITIVEGRYHQVRRMFAAVGNRVVALQRVAVGGLLLDERLAPGEWRELDVDEIRRVVR